MRGLMLAPYMKLSNPRRCAIVRTASSIPCPIALVAVSGARTGGKNCVRSRTALTGLICSSILRGLPSASLSGARLRHGDIRPPSSSQPLPPSLRQCLDRAERRLVSHLLALRYPVTQVQIRQTQIPATLDLPKDAIRAVAGARRFGIVEGIDRGESVVQPIDQAHHPQPAFFAEFEQIGPDIAVKQKVLVLLAAVLIHPAARVAVPLITKVQGIMFAIKRQMSSICS